MLKKQGNLLPQAEPVKNQLSISIKIKDKGDLKVRHDSWQWNLERS